MPTRTDIERRRIAEAEKARNKTLGVVRLLQSAFAGTVLDWAVGSLETDGGRLTYTAKNLGKVATVYTLFSRFQKRFEKTVLGDVLNYAGRLFGLNREYFETFTEPTENVFDAARRLTLQRWGYNTATRELIPGGYFEALFSNAGIAQRVAGLVNQAIAQKMPLAEFQKTFRQVFVGKPGQGMLERHWKTNSLDLYQRLDRTANLIYADRLGLEYAVYSGTLMETSRPFCIARVHKVFSRQEIKGWERLQFAGKPKRGYDPFTDCGGHFCRHHLSWVSNEIAGHLKQTQK